MYQKYYAGKRPPPNEIHAPIVHTIGSLYKFIYANSRSLSKGNKLGIRSKTENICLNCLHLSINAALLSGTHKLPYAEKLQIEIEMLKHLIRLEVELKIINESFYAGAQGKLQEISRMAAGWIKYLQKKESR